MSGGDFIRSLRPPAPLGEPTVYRAQAAQADRRPEGAVQMEARMLVLTRKTNQSIMIGDDVEVTVLAVSRDKIRLGISAPKEVPVYRKEVWLSMKDGTVEPADGEADDAESKDEIEGAIIDGAAAKVEEALGRAE